MFRKFQSTKKKEKDKLNLLQNKSNSDKLDVIISEIKTIKTDIVKIKTDIVDFREEFKKYKKQDSDFQESRTNIFIMSILDNNRTTYSTKLLPIKNIYTPYSNKSLSEFDGLILYTPNHHKMPNISSNLLERTDKHFYHSLKDNISENVLSTMKI